MTSRISCDSMRRIQSNSTRYRSYAYHTTNTRNLARVCMRVSLQVKNARFRYNNLYLDCPVCEDLSDNVIR
uniref:Uncharacterized protein n=1 Tax=Pararge aegeria TaxID=116150 RepID=S4NKV9_9NEOP